MADPAPKAPPPPQPIDWDVTEFVRNPGGAILDINKSHPAATLAAGNREGWRFATLEEAKKYCETNNIDPKGLDGYAAHVKEAQKSAEKTEAPASEESAATEEPKQATKK